MTARTAARGTSARRRVRAGAAAAGLAAALVLTGCSGDDGDAAKEPKATPSATDKADGGTDSGGSTGGDAKLQGNWLATTDGKPVALFVNGEEAALFVVGGTVCSGKVSDEADMRMIELKCTDGTKDRTSGMVDSVDSTSLTVTWDGKVGEETFQKTEGALPSGLPTDLPTAASGS
ncbi:MULTISPECIES: hypothetical protein [Streptomyces]|uniref:Secreted protein n=1 Tax=Streptomyces heilongjiangensis TaxID=945052 RepID=A0ABW1BEQ9_9ACTN|nr:MULTISPECIES: hypothetical protein [Streptomyces]MDC2949503.1 hypothetical protein [Streptomyces heilongjiangensis]